MTIILRQSTASQVIPLGYFVDSTDGDSEETALTLANTDIKLWKAGATTLASKNSGGATHISNGVYYATLDATDTNTVGPLVIFVHKSGALAEKVYCTVLEEAIYDAYYAASAFGYSTAMPVGAVPALGIQDSGTALAGGSASITYRAAASMPENSGVTELWTGTGAYQSRLDYSYNNTTKVTLVDPAWTTNPDSTSGYICRALPPTPTLLALMPRVDIGAISQDTTAADNMESAYDGTGYNVGNGSIVVASVTGAVGSLGATAQTNVSTTVAALLNAVIADSVPADGTRPSISQALYMLTQFMLERSVSGTTMTVRKADGATTLMTLTLNDATSPTSVTRTT